MDRKTYLQWQQTGRQVKKGAKAKTFLVSPDDSRRLGLFTFDQTQELNEDVSDWREVASADLPPKRVQPKKNIFRYRYENGRVHAWVGTEKGRTIMKSHKFKWYPPTGRWHRDASRAQVEAMIGVFRGLGYEVIEDGVQTPDF